MRDLFSADAPIAHNGAPTLRWCLACHGASTRAGCTWCFGLGYDERTMLVEEMTRALATGTVSTLEMRARMRREKEFADA